MATQVITSVNRNSIGELIGSNGNSEAVLYIEQDLTTEQKAQARTNIGVAVAAKAVYLGNVVGTV